MRFLLLLSLITYQLSAQEQVLQRLRGPVGRLFFEESAAQQFDWKGDGDTLTANNHRGVAIALGLTLGIFGMHRIYLGTSPLVPVFYTVTIGGGMVLWLADIAFLIFTKDITQFYNRQGVFMWSDRKSG